ncbi:MAG: hypothetical protein A2X18_10555 [Bacteroidetes bacterium GWF2_40_14]|nr:MAG: hypothetical protein A2X18_10555 [Bacteroidetes bacterium GWF2_40_14]
MLNSNKVSEIKIIISGFLRDLDSLNNSGSISPVRWEELNIAADLIKQKLNTLMIEQERYSKDEEIRKLNQTIAELKRSFSDVQLNVSKSFLPHLPADEKSKLRIAVEEEEMELFYDGRTSILDAAESAIIAWKTDLPGPAIENLNHAITLNDKLFFIKGLFNDDEEQYRLSIQKLNEMRSMEEALEYTRAAFPDWDETSNIIYRFYMILRRKLDV